jgi:hypothetical protein
MFLTEKIIAKKTPHRCHSVFHSSTQATPFSKFCRMLRSVLFLWFIFGQEASDANWNIFKQCSVFHMRLDQTHGEILQELTPLLCFILRTCHVQNMSIYACNVEELEKYA